MMLIPELLDESMLVDIASKPWKDDVRLYLGGIHVMMANYILVNYDNLVVLSGYEKMMKQQDYKKIADIIYLKLKNEIEKIYDALTLEYKVKFNYYRSIIEKNEGQNDNVYGGNDVKETSGSDNTEIRDSLDVDNDVKVSESTISRNTYDTSNEGGLRPITKENQKYTDHEDYEGNTNTTTNYGRVVTDKYGKTLSMKFGRIVDTEIEGNNGIYPYPDLIKKEYDLRMKHQLFVTIVDLFVKEVSSGVWNFD